MTIQIIGWYCLIHVTLGELALIFSVMDKDVTDTGARARVNFINIGYIAVAAWCFK